LEESGRSCETLISIQACEDGLWRILENGRETSRASDEERLLVDFDRRFHIAVGACAREHTFVHAGVVVVDGRAVLLPGPTFAGKSRLVEAFVSQGAAFYSDDLAVLDQRGWVQPYPKPLSIRGRGLTCALELGWHPDLPSLPVAAVAVVRHNQRAKQLSLKRLSPSQTVFELIANCLSIRRQPARDSAVLARLAAEAPGYKGSRAEAGEAALRLMEIIFRQASPRPRKPTQSQGLRSR